MAIAEGGGSRRQKMERCRSLSARLLGIGPTNRRIALYAHMTNFDGDMNFCKFSSWMKSFVLSLVPKRLERRSP